MITAMTAPLPIEEEIIKRHNLKYPNFWRNEDILEKGMFDLSFISFSMFTSYLTMIVDGCKG